METVNLYTGVRSRINLEGFTVKEKKCLSVENLFNLYKLEGKPKH